MLTGCECFVIMWLYFIESQKQNSEMENNKKRKEKNIETNEKKKLSFDDIKSVLIFRTCSVIILKN